MWGASSAIATFLLAASHSASALRGPRKLSANGLHVRTLQDFNWDVQPVDGFPVISFNATASDEVAFRYNHSGTLGTVGAGPAVKLLSFALYNGDCNVTVADTTYLALSDAAGGDVSRIITSNSEVNLGLDIKQETIVESEFYEESPDGLSAEISFCVRGDYVYDDDGDANTENESVNFHETVIVISVDLMANFSLTSISTNRTAADRNDVKADIDCDAKAYFCDDNRDLIANPTLSQGEILQFCVEIADEDAGRLWIKDLVEVDLEQDNNANAVYRDTGDEFDDLVSNFAAQGILTGKDCTTEPGICQVKTQLASKYFTDLAPNPLDVFGVALCAFGSPP
jgi:hypothetical protein